MISFAAKVWESYSVTRLLALSNNNREALVSDSTLWFFVPSCRIRVSVVANSFSSRSMLIHHLGDDFGSQLYHFSLLQFCCHYGWLVEISTVLFLLEQLF